MKKITMKEVDIFLNAINYDISNNLFTKKDLRNGMNVEREHGLCCSITNVTNDNLILTGKIALIHLLEIPDYYDRLKILESEGKQYWKNKLNNNN